MMKTIYLKQAMGRAVSAVGRIFGGRLPGGSALLLALALAGQALIGSGPGWAQAEDTPPAVATVNINTADEQALSAGLVGVGRSRAEEIVRYREAFGPFSSVEELKEVKGINTATLEKNRAVITLD